MSVRFNPPPLWLQHLPANFRPTPSWVPDAAWGAPPAGWPMWVNLADGQPANPPAEYSANPYLYMSVMPGAAPVGATPPSVSNSSAPQLSSVDSSGAGAQNPKKKMSRGKKIGIGVVGLVVLSIIVGSCGGSDEQPSSTPEPTESAIASPSEAQAAEVIAASPEDEASAKAEAEASTKAQEEAEASAEAEEEASAKAEAEAKAEEEAKAKSEAEASAKAEAEASAKAEAEAGTVGQQNALRAAENYLGFMPFSRTGLIKQLAFEDYSKKDATWAVDRVDADWNEQAVKSAENYLDTMSFSRKGLVDQLIFEGYTRKQAEHGVSKTGL